MSIIIIIIVHNYSKSVGFKYLLLILIPSLHALLSRTPQIIVVSFEAAVEEYACIHVSACFYMLYYYSAKLQPPQTQEDSVLPNSNSNY